MSLHKLIFDTTSAATIADSHSVGAYLRASDGTLLTHTDVGGKKALDVRLAEGVNVEVDLAHTDDSVRLGDGTDFFTSTTVGADIGLDVNIINASIAVTATDLDIRNLVFATDKVDVSGSSVTVSATDLDIRNLSAAQDSVAAWLSDGSGNAISSTGGSLNVNLTGSTGTIAVSDAALANTAIATASNTMNVANTAENLVTAPLASRKYLWAYNNSNRTAFIGASGVDSATGFPIPPGAYVSMRAGAAIDIEWVSPLAGADMRTMELA